MDKQGRLQEGPSSEMVESAFSYEMKQAYMLWPGYCQYDLAYFVMLFEKNIIPEDIGRTLLKYLYEMYSYPLSQFKLNPKFGDIYNYRENWLAESDPLIGGWYYLGRSRREANFMAYLLAVRKRVLNVCEAYLTYIQTIVNRARENSDKIVTDYTNLQAAQPTTLGHYLLSFAYPGLRDLQRMQATFGRLNQSPGGIGINGSPLDLDRQRVSELLGFDALLTHPRDAAMWQSDMAIEVMSSIVCLMINLDRLAEDFLIWCTQEFDLIEISDQHSRSSTMMPQKKNPYSLGFVRGMTGELTGRMASVACVGKTPSAPLDNRIFATTNLPSSLDMTIDAVRLMSEVLQTLRFNTGLMEQRAAENLNQATDLAIILMQKFDLDYRKAHTIVGKAVRAIVLKKRNDQSFDFFNDLKKAAQEIADLDLTKLENEIRSCLDPKYLVSLRKGIGGTASESLEDMFSEVQNYINDYIQWISNINKKISDAEVQLLSKVKNII